MSYLAINTFDAGFTTYSMKQKVDSTCRIKSVRMKMIKCGTIADGSLTLDILDGATILGTKTLTYGDFNSIQGTYAHGLVSFTFDSQVVINLNRSTTNVELTFRLTMTGHTPDSNNYLGLVRQFENTFITEYGSRPTSISPEDDGWYNPFGLEIHTIT